MKGKILEEKKRFKLNKLIIYVNSNPFYLFLSIIYGLKNFKIYKNFVEFDYIGFSFIFSNIKPNIRKLFSLVVFRMES